MRARNLKPSIYKNELLAVADPLYTVVFTGLWCAADREGRLEDRPAKWHMEINPGRGFDSTERSLAWLTEHDFIRRYSVDGADFMQVVKFRKHQNPHYKEPPSSIPVEPKTQGSGVNHRAKTLGSSVNHDASSEKNPSLAPVSAPTGEGKTGLIPDSGFLTPDSPSLIPDSGLLIPDSPPPVGRSELAAQAAAKSNGNRGTRLPENFVLTPERRKYAIAHGVEPEPTFAMFTTYWRSKSGSGATKVDWDSTWQHWCLKDQKSSRPKKTRFQEIQDMRRANQE